MAEANDSRFRRLAHHPHVKRVLAWVLGFHGSPTQVARGMAVGVFIAFTPTIGFQMIVAVVAATLTYSNRTAALVAVWITNPLTALPIYMMTYRVGRVFTPDYPQLNVRRRLLSVVIDDDGEWLHFGQQLQELMSLGKQVLVPLSIGGVIVGLVAGVIAYVLTRVSIEVGGRYFPRLVQRHESRGKSDTHA